MNLGILVSDFRSVEDAVSRFKADKVGLIFVSNGIYHTAVKEGGRASSLLDLSQNLYALTEDLATRGLSKDNIDSRIKLINYSDLVDLIFNEYEKTVWV